jgi:hypothetical protein
MRRGELLFLTFRLSTMLGFGGGGGYPKLAASGPPVAVFKRIRQMAVTPLPASIQ